MSAGVVEKLKMATLNADNGTLRIMSKSEGHLANAAKANYMTIKGKGEPFPKGVSIALFDVEMIEGTALPKVFDVIYDEDNGVIQRRIRIMNCRVQAEYEGKTLAISTAPDVKLT